MIPIMAFISIICLGVIVLTGIAVYAYPDVPNLPFGEVSNVDIPAWARFLRQHQFISWLAVVIGLGALIILLEERNPTSKRRQFEAGMKQSKGSSVMATLPWPSERQELSAYVQDHVEANGWSWRDWRLFRDTAMEASGEVVQRIHKETKDVYGDVWHEFFLVVRFMNGQTPIRLMGRVNEKLYGMMLEGSSLAVHFAPTKPALARFDWDKNVRIYISKHSPL